MTSSSGGVTDWILGSAKARLCCFKQRTVDDIPSRPTSLNTHGGDSRLTTFAKTDDIPVPETEEELNDKFTELVNELGLHGPHRDAMFSLSPEKKWQIYCSKKTDKRLSNSSLQTPENYIADLNALKDASGIDTDVLRDRSLVMESLKTALRSQPMSFVLQFLELGGLDALLNFLEGMDEVCRQQQIHTSAIACIQNIMNGLEGRKNVLSHPTAIRVIAQSLVTTNVRTKIAVLELLGATCLVPGGHHKVLQAMTFFQEYSKERTRFQSLVHDLDVTLDDFRWNVTLKTAIMSFINALIRCGPGQTHLEFRLHLRYEFLMLGVQSAIEKLHLIDNDTLNKHVDFFEMVRANDEKEFARRFSESHVDSKSASSMFELLRKKLSFGLAYPHLLSIFFHLLQLPTTGTRVVQYWQLIDRIVQQVTLQNKNSNDADVAPLNIDVKKLVSQLTSEAAIKDVQQKMREVEKTNDELTSKLAKRERESESRLQEKEELMQILNNVKVRTEKEASIHLEQINHLTCRVVELEQLLEQSKTRPEFLSTWSSSGFSSIQSPVSPPFIDSPPGAPGVSAGDGSVPVPAPPPLPTGIPPPPPPPPPGGILGLPVKTKNCPQPNQPLKSFNWTKLPDNKLQGTIWMEIDDTRAFKKLDLEHLERNFSAYQRQDDLDGGSKSPAKARELTVIDGRRAQNCTIMLSKLKMTNEELIKAIMSVDSQGDIPKDMCEQLLKFVPTAEETQMLAEHAREQNQMARADHFLFDMSRIEHYEERLKALFFKKNYSERIAVSIPRVKDVLEASTEVANSKSLRGVLEIVLAFGNYMNRGQRGNASGFRIASLNKIVDTKSSINKRSTLLHYLAEVIDQKYENLLSLDEELRHVKEAAKIKLTELDVEVAALRMGLKDIEKELEYQRGKSADSRSKDDCFVQTMTQFLQLASCRFLDLEYDFRDMKERFDRCVILMGEEAKKIQPDEFFGTFDQFLTSLSEARQENSLWQKMKDEEERRTLKEAEMKAERERRKNASEPNLGQLDQDGEMEELICALKNLNAFGIDSTPLKKKTRVRAASHGQVLSTAAVLSTPKDRRPVTSASQDRIYMIS